MPSAFATMTPASSADSSPAPLKYQFINAALLNEALTHKSYVNERKSPDRKHNERLEFLGDAVLSLIISDHLATRYPQLSEGALSKLKAKLVSETSLANAARRLDLGARLQLGRGEELSKGREKASLLADALEAVIAAVYLDGGLEVSYNFTMKYLKKEIDIVCKNQHEKNYKSILQQYSQKEHNVTPNYRILQQIGPDHGKSFEVIVLIKGTEYGIGWGKSKKEAEQSAAKGTLKILVPDLIRENDDKPCI